MYYYLVANVIKLDNRGGKVKTPFLPGDVTCEFNFLSHLLINSGVNMDKHFERFAFYFSIIFSFITICGKIKLPSTNICKKIYIWHVRGSLPLQKLVDCLCSD